MVLVQGTVWEKSNYIYVDKWDYTDKAGIHSLHYILVRNKMVELGLLMDKLDSWMTRVKLRVITGIITVITKSIRIQLFNYELIPINVWVT